MFNLLKYTLKIFTDITIIYIIKVYFCFIYLLNYDNYKFISIMNYQT